MKIGLVLDDTLDKDDGVQTAVITIGKWLSRQGHEVHYLVGQTERKDLKNVHSLGKYINLRYNKNNVRLIIPGSRKKIKELLKEENFDVLHVMLPYNPFMGKLVVNHASRNTAVVGTFHMLPASPIQSFSNQLLRLLLWRSLKRFDSVVAVSEPAVHFARKAYGLNASYLPNPITIEDFNSGRRMSRYKGGKLNIMFLGRLVKRKGALELVKAYNAISDEVASRTRLIIGGKGPLRNKVKMLISSNRDVELAGYVAEKDKANFLASADIAVFPSITGEAFGIVLVEAMAAGAGVVLGGNNPGYKSVLGAQPYLLFNPLDTAGFSEQLELFVKDDSLRKKMHEWQQQTIKQYDISNVGKNLVNIYEQALHERKKVG